MACGIDTGGIIEQTDIPDEQLTEAPTYKEETEIVDEISSRKIAIFTVEEAMHDEIFWAAQEMVKKYPGRIIHKVWHAPEVYGQGEPKSMLALFEEITDDPEVEILVINIIVPWVVDAVKSLLETRDDLFVIFCTPHEDPEDVLAVAALVIDIDTTYRQNHRIDKAIVRQAHEMGARTFINYYPPRYMASPVMVARMDSLASECESLGIEFASIAFYDPMGVGNPSAAFILRDVPERVSQYGKDTAIFSFAEHVQTALIIACLEERAIFPSPFRPSPYEGFPAALALEGFDYNDLLAHINDDVNFVTLLEKPELVADIGFIKGVQAEISEKIIDAGMGGRFSTWPFPSGALDTFVAVDYAIKWMEGETDGNADIDVLLELMGAYVGSGVDIELFARDGVTYDNYVFYMQPYLTFR